MRRARGVEIFSVAFRVDFLGFGVCVWLFSFSDRRRKVLCLVFFFEECIE